jgi:hypothetical protein
MDTFGVDDECGAGDQSVLSGREAIEGDLFAFELLERLP